MRKRKLKVGIIGCGAIGSRIAKSIVKDLNDKCRLKGLFDIDSQKSRQLAKTLASPRLIKKSLDGLLSDCDFAVEAVNAKDAEKIIRKALRLKKHVLAMSVGKLVKAPDLFRLAEANQCSLLIPSGAVAGMDAVKAACQVPVSAITLTTRKPLASFAQNPYLARQGINLQQIQGETVIFEGNVTDAVKYFPQNINVAATLSLASQNPEKIRIRILTSPEFMSNSHEIELTGDFGRIATRTDNIVCPDNPKTSYLAVLSAIQTLKQYFDNVKIGT